MRPKAAGRHTGQSRESALGVRNVLYRLAGAPPPHPRARGWWLRISRACLGPARCSGSGEVLGRCTKDT